MESRGRFVFVPEAGSAVPSPGRPQSPGTAWLYSMEGSTPVQVVGLAESFDIGDGDVPAQENKDKETMQDSLKMQEAWQERMDAMNKIMMQVLEANGEQRRHMELLKDQLKQVLEAKGEQQRQMDIMSGKLGQVLEMKGELKSQMDLMCYKQRELLEQKCKVDLVRDKLQEMNEQQQHKMEVMNEKLQKVLDEVCEVKSKQKCQMDPMSAKLQEVKDQQQHKMDTMNEKLNMVLDQVCEIRQSVLHNADTVCSLVSGNDQLLNAHTATRQGLLQSIQSVVERLKDGLHSIDQNQDMHSVEILRLTEMVEGVRLGVMQELECLRAKVEHQVSCMKRSMRARTRPLPS